VATYRYLTYDILRNEVLADLPFADVTYNEVLNNAGSFSGTLPMFGVDALSISTLEVGRCGLIVQRDNDIVWNGIVWTVEADAVNQKVRVGAEGTWSYFQQRIVRTSEAYGDLGSAFASVGLTGPYYYDADPLVIARELVQYAQATSIFGWNADIHVLTGSEVSSAKVETYELNDTAYGTRIGQEVETLAREWEHGFDFRITAAWENGSLAKRFRCGQPHLGGSTDAVYELGRNIAALTVQYDGKQLAGFVLGTGAGQGLNQVVQFYKTPGYEYPLFDHAAAWGTVDDDTRVAWLTIARANQRKVVHAIPRITTTDILDPQVHSLVPGCIVEVRASYGYIDLDSTFRVMSYSVAPENDGSATIQIDLAPTEMFDE